MSITTWGWGSCANAISTWGWGGCPCVDYIPHILAEYLGSKAYTCVVTRTYIEVRTRDRGDVVLRMKPDPVVLRSAGWPSQSGRICD